MSHHLWHDAMWRPMNTSRPFSHPWWHILIMFVIDLCKLLENGNWSQAFTVRATTACRSCYWFLFLFLSSIFNLKIWMKCIWASWTLELTPIPTITYSLRFWERISYRSVISTAFAPFSKSPWNHFVFETLFRSPYCKKKWRCGHMWQRWPCLFNTVNSCIIDLWFHNIRKSCCSWVDIYFVYVCFVLWNSKIALRLERIPMGYWLYLGNEPKFGHSSTSN